MERAETATGIMERIGLLYDSVSDNTGDKAIGLVLSRLLARDQVPHQVVDPFQPVLPAGVRTLVIGGGELIRGEADPFYAVFRVPGRHILNTVGVLDGSATDYLDDYRLVSVRSAADRSRLGRGEVAPCLTVLYGDVVPEVSLPVEIPNRAVGIHVTHAMAVELLALAEGLCEARVGPIVWLPITPYNQDFALMRLLQEQVPGSILLPVMDPDQIYEAIGGLRFLVTCSLHGALFAYGQRIPFLAYDDSSKINAFMVERGFESRLFYNAGDVLTGLTETSGSTEGMKPSLERDVETANAFVHQLVAQCREALAVPQFQSEPLRIPGIGSAGHTQMMAMHHALGNQSVTLLTWMTGRPASRPLAGIDELAVGGESTSFAQVKAAILMQELQALKKRARLRRGSMDDVIFEEWIRFRDLLLPHQTFRRRAFDWMIRSPVRRLHHALRFLFNLWREVGRRIERAAFPRRSRHWVRHAVLDPAYAAHVRSVEPSPRTLTRQAAQLAVQLRSPEVTILTHVPNRRVSGLALTLAAIQGQMYPAWEWVILTPFVNLLASEFARILDVADSRIRILPIEPSMSLPASLNDGVKASRGEWIVLQRLGDSLSPDALSLLVQEASENPAIELVYADFDHLDERGYRIDPVFLPDWSPETMLSFDLFQGFGAFRRDPTAESWVFRELSGPAARHEFFLRVGRENPNIRHIARVLSHKSLAAAPLHETIHQSILEHRALMKVFPPLLAKEGVRDLEISLRMGGGLRFEWDLAATPTVSIIIPSKNAYALVERCITSILTLTDYPSFKIYLVDTGSDDPAVESLYGTFAHDPRFEFTLDKESFNFSRVCNFGAQVSAGELILFMNNDTEVLTGDWLRRMVQWFVNPDVGIVGCKLLYPDRTIQHAGVIVGMGGMASHLLVGEDEGVQTIFGEEAWYRNFSAVTAACMLVRRTAFETVGGFDEGYQLNYSDVELCLKVREAGYRIVYTPDARLLHHEHSSHQRNIPRSDFQRLSERLNEGGYLDGDPYFNPNLSYMSAYPIFKRSSQDEPEALNRRLMRRLPAKEILTLPDDLQ